MMSTQTEIFGKIHWQISPKGDMMLGISGQDINFKSGPQIEKSKQWRRWHHLAVTIDTETRRVRMFWNGKMVHSSARSKPIPNILLDNAMSGRYYDTPIRWLNGAIGEQAIFSRILSLEEIRTIYNTGK